MRTLKPIGSLLFPVVCGVGFFLGVEAGSFQFVLLKISEEFDLNNTQMGSLVSVQFLAMLICPLIIGRLSDKIEKKKIAACFSLVFSFGCIVCTFIHSLSGFVIGIFIVGGSFITTQNATISSLSEAYGQRSGKYVSICQCLFALGAVSGPILANFAMMKLGFDWRIVFYVCGIAFIILSLLIFITKFENTVAESLEKPTASSSSIKSIFSVTLVYLLFSMMLYMIAENGFTYFLNTFFTNNLHAPGMSAFAISSFWVGTAISRLAGSALHKHQRKLVASCFLFSVFIILIITMSTSAVLCAILCFSLGFIFGPIWPYLMSQANEEFPRYMGTVTSLMSVAGSIGGASAPLIVGITADAAGIRVSYLVLAAIALVGAMVYLRYYVMFQKKLNGGKISL